MAGDRETLVGMGFDSGRVDWALKATGNSGLQPAMDHILQHDGEPIPDLGNVTETSGTTRTGNMDVDEIDEDDIEALRRSGIPGAAAAAAASDQAEAKSIKCSECGKIFKNTALANFHAEKSGHDQFEESVEEVKPLTEEEKKEKLEELRVKMAEKRAKKAAEEAKEHHANEILRRKAGKDIGKLKEEMKVKEALKEAEAKKREKIEDAKAKAAVKAQIEADRKARAEKTAKEKALREGQPLPTTSSPLAPVARPAAGPSGTASKEFKETRLQIRLASGGQPYTTTLPSEASLREVAEFLAGQNMNVDVDTVSFAQHFPRKTFSPQDFSKSLKDLGLTPSAVLIANTP